MAKSALRLEARELRKKGFGIKTIAYKLHVSSSTVSLWCRDIQLTNKQIKQLEKNMHDPYYGRRLAYVRQQQLERKKREETLMQDGIHEIGSLTHRDMLLTGIGLYWAEGFKKDSLVGFSNSDPNMVNIFLKWLYQCCGVTKDRIKMKIGINEHYRDEIQKIEDYWSKVTSIPRSQFQKAYIQKVQWKKKYDHPEDYHGVIRIRVSRSIALLRKINGWIEGLKRNRN